MNKQQHIVTITSKQQFDVNKPRYNAHQTGHGVQASKKSYTRKTKHRYCEGE